MRASVIWFASLLHMLWGALLLISVDPTGATPVATLLAVFRDREALALVLFAVAFSALYGMRHAKHFWMVIPQQIVLVVSAVGALFAVFHGMYADGVARPTLFILSDQAPVILTAPLYTAAVLFGDTGHARVDSGRH